MVLDDGGFVGGSRRSVRLRWLVGLLFPLLLLVGGCGAAADVSQARAALARQGSGDIRIGVAWPFAKAGDLFLEGVELAVEEINGAGGVLGRRLAIMAMDDEGSVTRGMEIAQSLAENPEVVAVIGHRNSFISLPTAEIYEKAGLLMLTPGSTAPELTQKGYRFVFRSIPSDDAIGRRLVHYAYRQGHRRMVIYYVDDAYGRGLANAIEDHATGAGIRIVDRISYYGDLNDLKYLHEKWRALGFDGIFVAETIPHGAELIAKMREVGIQEPVMAGNALDSPALPEIAGEAAEGVVVGSVVNFQDERPIVQDFVRAFREKYGTFPNQWAAQGYDAVRLLAAAMEKAGTAEPAAVAETLRGMKSWPGVAGFHTYDESGDVDGELVVLKTVRQGMFVEIE